MRWSGVATLGLASFVAAGACGRTMPEPTELHGAIGASRVSVAAENACRASAQALCARAVACSPLYIGFFFETVADCEALVTETCTSAYEGPGTSDAPKDCVAEARAAPCELAANVVGSLSLSTAALELLRLCPTTSGRFHDHAACLRDGDCGSGACGELIRGGTCTGCIPQRHAGESCETNPNAARCEGTSRCVAGRCAALLGGGAECSVSSLCTSGTCAEGHCLTPLGEGAMCDPAASACDISHALICASSDRRCHPVSIVGPGEACDPLPGHVPDTVLRLCDARAECVEGKCTPRPRRGEPCTDRCRMGLSCRDGRCVTLVLNDRTSCIAP
jgi:hypothetical protein